MLYDICIGNKNYKWTEETVKDKLEAISNLKGKEAAWIVKNLNVNKSSILGRLFWTFIGKYFQCLREIFYNVNLEQSKNVLLQIHKQIRPRKTELLKIYHLAISKFNQIAPHHFVKVQTDLLISMAGPTSGNPNHVQTPGPLSLPVEVELNDDEEDFERSNDKEEIDFRAKRENTLAQIAEKYPISKDKIKTVKNLVEEYSKCWDPEKAKYSGKEIEKYGLDRFFSTLHEYTSRFGTDCNYQKNYGFIEKKELPKDSIIGVHADFHGDLKSLAEVFIMFQKNGLLDSNFKCMPNVTLIFLGDYPDRGEHSLPVLELLACLKMENPDQVFLIRGNHEYTMTNMMFASPKIEKAYGEYYDETHPDHKLRKEFLENFYETMPLTVYFGQENKGGKKQFAQFTHGLFEITCDPIPILEDPLPYSRTYVPKTRLMSERIRKVKVDENLDYDFLIQNCEKSYRKELKKLQATKRLKELIEQDVYRRSEALTTFNWGDVADGKSSTYFGDPGARRWSMTPKDIKLYMRAISTINIKLSGVLRGHQHKYDLGLHNKKVVVSTLPVGMDSLGYKNRYDQKSRAYILTIAEKVKDWKKQAITRSSGKDSDPDLTESHSIYSDAV